MGATALVSVAAVIVVIFGMQAASAILVPLLVSAFAAVICTPLMRWLQHYRVPAGLAVLIVMLLIIGVLTLVGIFIGGQFAEFRARLPFYEEQLNTKVTGLAALFGQEASITDLLERIKPASPMELVANLFSGLQGLLANFFLIIFTVVFLLLEASSFPGKLQLVLTASRGDPEYFKRFTSGVQRYLGIKTIVSLVTGVAAAALTAAFGLDFPLLWGLLAFLFNYVPNIGSLIAAIPAVVLALIQFGFGQAAMIAAGYFIINITIGGIIEPRVVGRGLGLSTLVVFLSLVFWGWVFGPVGMLLSVPLTMTAKIALDSSDRTAPIAVLLGPAERVPSR